MTTYTLGCLWLTRAPDYWAIDLWPRISLFCHYGERNWGRCRYSIQSILSAGPFCLVWWHA